jgi:DNA-binding response OmpR family regulator
MVVVRDATGHETPLAQAKAALLRRLLEDAGQAVSHDDLLLALDGEVPSKTDESRSRKKEISRLLRSLDELLRDSRGDALIKELRGVGYVIKKPWRRG